MWFDPGLARLFITSTLLHLGEDINSLVVSLVLPQLFLSLIKTVKQSTLASIPVEAHFSASQSRVLWWGCSVEQIVKGHGISAHIPNRHFPCLNANNSCSFTFLIHLSAIKASCFPEIWFVAHFSCAFNQLYE
jgi:hypothetical protein